MELLDNDVTGPSMPEHWTCSNFVGKSNAPESMVDSIFAIKPAVDRLRNYSSGQAKASLNIFADVCNDGVATSVGYSQLCKVDAESDYEAADDPFNINMDYPTDATTITMDNTQQQVDVRGLLKPLFDKICTLYEGRDATHCEMPTIGSVVDSMNNKILEVNGFFNELCKKKSNRQHNDDRYISVCTQQETRRCRNFVSSNGLG